MSKREHKIIKYRLCNWPVFILGEIAIALSTIAGGAILAEKIRGPLWRLIFSLCPSILDSSIISIKNYYSLIVAATLLAEIALSYIYGKHFIIKVFKRNRVYIEKIFANDSSSSIRMPAATRKQLIIRLLGENIIRFDTSDINSYIDMSVRAISNFLQGNEPEDTLVINSKWGTGKTTALLIAINETPISTNRYIYESAFRYVSGVSEFSKDLLNALYNTLFELSIDVRRDIIGLIRNLDPNPAKIFLNAAKNDPGDIMLTTELIEKINAKYDKSNKENIIFVIIDDLDRMPSGEIVKILSLLSILRKLKFVRIITPVDLNVLTQTLEAQMIQEPERFINKYLPEQTAINIDYGYRMMEEIILAKIAADNKEDGASIEYCAILAAILFKLLSDKLGDKTHGTKNDRVGWLTLGDVKVPDDLSTIPRRILTTAPKFMAEKSGNIIGDTSQFKYRWNKSTVSVKVFESIIYQIKDSNKNTFIRDGFTDEEYEKLIASWIFEYMEIHWDEYDFTLREALDIMNQLLKNNTIAKDKTSPAAQFVATFNVLFPKRQIKLSPITRA